MLNKPLQMKKPMLMKKPMTCLALSLLLAIAGASLQAQSTKASAKANIIINADLGKDVISRNIYGHFSEHLGHCIYDGYYVGEDSEIANTRGIRNDIVEALKKSGIPNLRWPGGCFADEYHWMDGIGPKDQRPKMINTHWGGVTEDNSFGTHEFLDLCEQLNTEPYICGNVGSGTVEEMSKWVEYINSDAVSPMADLRRANGRENSWGVKYWGVGNENWGCGGNMRPEFYADQYRRFATYCRSYGDNRLLKIAGGSHDRNWEWTEVMMREIPHNMMWGLSLHHYMTEWGDKGSATRFGEDEYFRTMRFAVNFGDLLDGHIAIMDRYEPGNRVALVVDEWGTWWDVEPGTNPGFLYQQNTLRDAFVAGLALNHMNQRCRRIKMANIAQTVNVLQAMVLTEGEKMILTPTYHVFEMYKVHQDATLLPLELDTDFDYEFDSEKLQAVSASASRDAEGALHVSLVNIHPLQAADVFIEIRGQEVSSVTGRILTAPELNSHNTFEKPDLVKPEPFEGAKLSKQRLAMKMPAKSIVVLEIK
jgi:alpha-N-arabinofuranosidase